MNTLTIGDVEMKPHPWAKNAWHGEVKFANGWGASVVKGNQFYTSPTKPWEIAVIDSDGEIAYDSGLTGDVFGYLTDTAATKVLADIAALSPKVKS